VIASTNPFEILAPPLASLLAFFYDHVIANYGIAIILMTLTVMVILAPLTWKGTRSMLAMQRLQPELKKIQQQHKNDRAALNEAMMAFYKEHNINPLGGCLPLLLQMPVFFGLYRAVAGLTHKDHTGQVVPKFIPHSTKLAQHLKADHGTMKAFGFDLAKSASSHHASFAAGLPYLLMVGLIVLTGWYQQRQLTNVNPQAAQANPQAAMMQKIFPVFFGLITFRFPAGVALYWLTQSVARIIQQWAMYRWDKSLTAEVKRDIIEVEEKAADLEPGKPKATRPGLVSDTPRKGFFARMMAAAATQQEARAKASGTKPTKTPGKPSTKPSANKPPANKPAAKKPDAGKAAPAKPGAPGKGTPSAPPSGQAGSPAAPANGGAPGSAADQAKASEGQATGSNQPTGTGKPAGGSQGSGNGATPPIRPNRPAPNNRAASRKRARRGR
jgi:YidC/Oxa1 family membrane protein insertase